eukprot:CAMPEP_0195142470 /NCGR_PEP_ID=MMETSP0448-20130528/164658_1 /TAXON_ID=66468 /ORGANISM="Heterocapsa triquestra, Strain CCMP 448" /LENGTH=47 /DNA_ID= /DNA_START= /DNA_END= /DNA_ORIENTATION=
MPTGFRNRSTSISIWHASSRVGASTRIAGIPSRGKSKEASAPSPEAG